MKKKRVRRRQNKKKICYHNEHFEQNVYCDADRFIVIDLLVYGNVMYESFESLCASLRSVSLIFCLMF